MIRRIKKVIDDIIKLFIRPDMRTYDFTYNIREQGPYIKTFEKNWKKNRRKRK